MDKNLIDAFRFWRIGLPKHSPYTATRALEMARRDVAANKCRYPQSHFAMRGGGTFEQGSESLFWCERPSNHLRLVGFADEIARSINHTGWYTDDDGDRETMRGVVYQLPARNGQTRFMYGYADPNNDGPACLSLTIATDKEDAARFADRVAERAAESERDYNRAWQAGCEYQQLGEEVAATRRDTLQLFAERRAAMSDAGNRFPALCASIAATISQNCRDVYKARKRRAELLHDYGSEPAFNEH